MMKLRKILAPVIALAAMTPASQAFVFNDGDLVLGFQAVGGAGTDKNVFFNLGSGTSYRDNAYQGEIGNIGTSLTAAFGATWYDRPDIYFGIIGNLNQNPTSGVGSRGPVDGDPSRTVYLSTAAFAPGAGQLFAAGTFGSPALGSGAGNFTGMENALITLPAQLDGAAIMDETLNPVQWNNSWSEWNPTPGAAFNVFTGGIQQNFGKAGDTTYIDLQRILATNTGADPTGTVGGGDYITTFGISSTGSIVAIPEPSTALLALAAAGLAFRRRRGN